MKRLELLVAGLLAFSPALFAQQSTSQPDSQNAAQSSQASQQAAAASANLTADQKAELKQLKEKAKEACKADPNSDACKAAKDNLHSKMDEYGVKPHDHQKGASSTGGNPPPQ